MSTSVSQVKICERSLVRDIVEYLEGLLPGIDRRLTVFHAIQKIGHMAAARIVGYLGNGLKTNLYGIAIGGPGRGKSAAQEILQRVLRFYTISRPSVEGIGQELQERKKMFVYIDEIHNVAKKYGRKTDHYLAEIFDFLRAAYIGTPFRWPRRKNPIAVPHDFVLSFYGTTTDRDFLDYVINTLPGGLLRRTFVIPVRSSINWFSKTVERESIIKRVKKALEALEVDDVRVDLHGIPEDVIKYVVEAVMRCFRIGAATTDEYTREEMMCGLVEKIVKVTAILTIDSFARHIPRHLGRDEEDPFNALQRLVNELRSNCRSSDGVLKSVEGVEGPAPGADTATREDTIAEISGPDLQLTEVYSVKCALKSVEGLLKACEASSSTSFIQSFDNVSELILDAIDELPPPCADLFDVHDENGNRVTVLRLDAKVEHLVVAALLVTSIEKESEMLLRFAGVADVYAKFLSKLASMVETKHHRLVWLSNGMPWISRRDLLMYMRSIDSAKLRDCIARAIDEGILNSMSVDGRSGYAINVAALMGLPSSSAEVSEGIERKRVVL